MRGGGSDRFGYRALGDGAIRQDTTTCAPSPILGCVSDAGSRIYISGPQLVVQLWPGIVFLAVASWWWLSTVGAFVRGAALHRLRWDVSGCPT